MNITYQHKRVGPSHDPSENETVTIEFPKSHHRATIMFLGIGIIDFTVTHPTVGQWYRKTFFTMKTFHTEFRRVIGFSFDHPFIQRHLPNPNPNPNHER